MTLVNQGRMCLVPVLVEKGGETDFFTAANTIDLLDDIYSFQRLDDFFHPVRFSISQEHRLILSDLLDGFDMLLTQHRWQEASDFFLQCIYFKNIPDYQFRLLVYSMCRSDFVQAKESYHLCEPFVGPGETRRLLGCYADIYQLPVVRQNMEFFEL